MVFSGMIIFLAPKLSVSKKTWRKIIEENGGECVTSRDDKYLTHIIVPNDKDATEEYHEVDGVQVQNESYLHQLLDEDAEDSDYQDDGDGTSAGSEPEEEFNSKIEEHDNTDSDSGSDSASDSDIVASEKPHEDESE